eukprot:TRINITY_DN1326_c0_g1_i2.p1 TRINITY_DN1326_c0_g1~~TRINITY_DN1326_c0_g1_i2.p1  ORF type:complete len:157 (+),score=11.55 TRINITY_DN1326_c0_g1_i2:432-902(+)
MGCGASHQPVNCSKFRESKLLIVHEEKNLQLSVMPASDSNPAPLLVLSTKENDSELFRFTNFDEQFQHFQIVNTGTPVMLVADTMAKHLPSIALAPIGPMSKESTFSLIPATQPDSYYIRVMPDHTPLYFSEQDRELIFLVSNMKSATAYKVLVSF